MRRVLFVSKPIVPPFHDGTRCLVRDVASHLSRYRAIVLTTRHAPRLGPGVEAEPLYPTAGTFAPAITDNARVLARLLLGSRADLWHFVFAPNVASSFAGRLAKGVRRVPTIQTVASAPRSFEGVTRLLFGDRIIVLSETTRGRLVRAGADARQLRLIPPPVLVTAPPAGDVAELRRALDLPEGAAVVTYPGDIERSSGAPLVASAIPALLAARPDAFVVFACRKKSARAEEAERRLREELAAHADRVRFAGELASLAPLLAVSELVLFPVDDLYGKVDLPIALLEAMVLGVPIVALDTPGLRELSAAEFVPADPAALARRAADLLADRARREELAARARALATARHDPAKVAAAHEEVYAELVL